MFCTNCGSKLPDNAKFCPNCGALVPDHAAPVPEAVQEADAVAAAALGAAEKVADNAAGMVKKAEENMAAAAQAVPEFVQNAADDVIRNAQAAADAVITAAQDAVHDAEETVRPVMEELREVPVPETVPEIVPEVIPELTAEPVAAEPVMVPAAPAAPPVQPQESIPASPYTQAQNGPAAPQPPVPPYTGGQNVPVERNEKGAGKKKGRGLIAALLTVLVLAGAFLAYWNLPSTKFGRYTKQAVSAAETADYEKAADLYHKALAIKPDDMDTINALADLYDEVQYRAVAAVNEGRFEDAVADAKMMAAILPEQEDNNAYAMYDIYSCWISDEAEKGNFDTVQTILARAEEDLTPDYADQVNTLAVNIRERMTLAETLRGSAATIIQLNSGKDYKGVFSELLNDLTYLKRYLELEGELPYAVFDTASSGVMFYYDESRDAAQVYIGGIADGNVESGYADTYYMSSASTSSRQYEYFSAENWSGGRPNGKFTEINFKSEPDTPTSSNSDTVSGVLNDGKYEGEIANNRNGKVYYMKFEYGKVQVLDTVDPNGDSGNVVGYTEDKNSWITFKDSGLTGSYGVRYLT